MRWPLRVYLYFEPVYAVHDASVLIQPDIPPTYSSEFQNPKTVVHTVLGYALPHVLTVVPKVVFCSWQIRRNLSGGSAADSAKSAS